MISVVIPMYNKAACVGHTLRTVQAQTFSDFEVVVVDDGSTDGSADIVERFDDARIRLVRQENAGVSAARNRGIEEAHYDLIAFLDADDEWKPDYLATQVALARKYPQCNVFCCNYEFRNAEGKVTSTIIRKLPFTGADGLLDNYFEVASCSHPPICSISIMVRKEAIQAVGGFPVGVKAGEDLLTWARLALENRIAYCRQPLAVFNVMNDRMTDKPKRIPAEVDYVGQELVALYRSCQNVAGLRHYVAHWFKMRSAIYMRLKMRRKSIREAMKSLKYRPANYKLYLYIAYNLVPHW